MKKSKRKYNQKPNKYLLLDSLLKGKRCLVGGLFSSKDKDYHSKIDSISRKIKSVEGIVVDYFVQRRGVSRSRKEGGAKLMDSPLNSRTLFSSGKVRELEELVAEKDVEAVVLVCSITQRQKDVLSRRLGVEVCSLPNSDN